MFGGRFEHSILGPPTNTKLTFGVFVRAAVGKGGAVRGGGVARDGVAIAMRGGVRTPIGERRAICIQRGERHHRRGVAALSAGVGLGFNRRLNLKGGSRHPVRNTKESGQGDVRQGRYTEGMAEQNKDGGEDGSATSFFV